MKNKCKFWLTGRRSIFTKKIVIHIYYRCLFYVNFNKQAKSKTIISKGKKESVSSKIEVHGTYDGKLFINSSDLFSLKKVQDLIERVKKSKVLSEVDRIELKGQ